MAISAGPIQPATCLIFHPFQHHFPPALRFRTAIRRTIFSVVFLIWTQRRDAAPKRIARAGTIWTVRTVGTAGRSVVISPTSPLLLPPAMATANRRHTTIRQTTFSAVARIRTRRRVAAPKRIVQAETIWTARTAATAGTSVAVLSTSLARSIVLLLTSQRLTAQICTTIQSTHFSAVARIRTRRRIAVPKRIVRAGATQTVRVVVTAGWSRAT
jgi:hypothetical protein